MPRPRDIRATDLTLPFAAFLDRLRQMGFTIGVDHHIRLQTVLKAFGPSSDLHRLKTRLCPLFAVSKRQQTQFYRAFDLFFNPTDRADADGQLETDEPEPEVEAPLKTRKAPYLIAAALWVALIGIVTVQWLPPVTVRKAQTTVTQTKEPDHPGPPDPVQVEREPDIRVEIPLNTRPPEITWYQQYGQAVWWAAVAAPLIIGIFWEARRAARRRWAIQRGKGRLPPHYLPVESQAPPPEFLRDATFYTAARLMRRRVAFEGQRLDIPRTIHQTLESGGFPRLAYRGLTRPPEYLFLIDLAAYDDHHARLCETVSDALKTEGVYVTRLFYATDPQVCFFTEAGDRYYLSEIIARYDRHRLILAGDGDALLDPVSGKPNARARSFRAWAERALLTYTPPERWGMREVALAGEFVLLPATLAGIEAVVRYFETPLRYHLQTWARADTPPVPLSSPDPIDLDALADYMGSPADFQWLAACAVYPKLSWGLTLRLAADMGHTLTENAVVRLVRLPWFREGAMPDELRRRLIARMPPETLKAARRSLLSAIEAHIDPDADEAAPEQRLLIFLNRWMVARENRRYLKETRKLVDQVGEDRIIEDHTLLDVLSSENASPLAFVLPERWHRFFFRKGISWFGLRTWVRMAVVVVVALTLARAVPVADEPKEIATESLTLTFAHIPDGFFMMGSPEDEPGRYKDESPRHEVTFSEGFYMQKTEVTQGQWKAVMGENPSYFKNCGDDCPVESVSWEDARAFIQKLNEIEGHDIYRLPSEAQWEYAARAGNQTAFANGEITELGCGDDPNLNLMGWYCGNSGVNYDGCIDLSSYGGISCAGTHPVAEKQPNAWGLYDMHGNIWEWCEDDYHDSYENAPKSGEPWIDEANRGDYRVVRGGSWGSNARGCRSAGRSRGTPDHRGHFLGFRLTRSYP